MSALCVTKQARILVIGSDDVLLHTRKELLRRQYEVETCYPQDAQSVLATKVFQLTLVCSSLATEKGRETVARVLKASPGVPVLQLLSLTSAPTQFRIADRVVSVDFRPESWLKAIREILGDDAQHCQR